MEEPSRDRRSLGVGAMMQGTLFGADEPRSPRERSGSFVENVRLPVHRWFRYSAGFSAQWAAEVIRDRASGARRVFDPFVGSGTVALQAERAGVEGVGVEAHPFVARVARAKLLWRQDPAALRRLGAKVADRAERGGTAGGYAPLVVICYPNETLARLDGLKKAWREVGDVGPLSELCWLALVSILRAASPVSTAQWQYVLPKKAKARAVEPVEAYRERVTLFAADMASWQSECGGAPPGHVLCGDARECDGVADGWADLVVTSPLRKQLRLRRRDAVGDDLVRGDRRLGRPPGGRPLAARPVLHPARRADRCQDVRGRWRSVVGSHRGGTDRRLFALGEGARGTRREEAVPRHGRLLLPRFGARLASLAAGDAGRGAVCFVVGDPAPYGVHVPVDRWLGELAVASGFRSHSFEKLRDRNTKWLNRKHRVPLREGLLWVEG